MRDQIADAQAGQCVGLGEGARHHQVGKPVEQRHRPAGSGNVHEFPVGLVDHDQRVRRNLREKALKRGIIEPTAGRIVGVGQKNDARVVAQRRRHGIQIVSIGCLGMVCRHGLDPNGACSRHRGGDGKHGKPEFRMHDRGL